MLAPILPDWTSMPDRAASTLPYFLALLLSSVLAKTGLLMVMTGVVVISTKPNARPTAALMVTMLPAVGVVFFKPAKWVSGVMLICVSVPATTPKACNSILKLVLRLVASSKMSGFEPLLSTTTRTAPV